MSGLKSRTNLDIRRILQDVGLCLPARLSILQACLHMTEQDRLQLSQRNRATHKSHKMLCILVHNIALYTPVLASNDLKFDIKGHKNSLIKIINAKYKLDIFKGHKNSFKN